MDRKHFANVLEDCATLLELQGENAFRCNAYRNAAKALLQIEGDLEQLAANKELDKVKGIGKTMAEKITELVQTGGLEFYERLKEEVPAGLVEMLGISGFGPKRIHQVYQELGIETVAGLKEACEDGRLAELKGFGAKLVTKIEEGIKFLDKAGKRVLYPVAREMADELLAGLRDLPQVERIALCGSLRRGRETIKDIDILVSSSDPEPIMETFASLPLVDRVTVRGPTKTSVVLKSNVAADLRVVTDDQFPFALHYFTGSKEHNVAIRGLAQQHGLKLNEYELAKMSGSDGNIPCKEEADIFAALSLTWIPPELRESMGEIEAAREHRLPKMIEESDIAGVFHCHTTASDGGATLKEMAEAAKAAGYHYLGIADHSKAAFYANGLDAERVRKQQEEIDALNAKMKGFRLFKGIESDILADGSLDYDDETLATFDYVVASIHQPMNMDEKTMTTRVVRAIRHPACTMIGHPTGRLLLQREGFPIDLDTVFREAVENDVYIEINAHPRRLDLDWTMCKRALSFGVKFVINPDAHSTEGYSVMPFGVLVARRGWLEAKNVLNTQSLSAVTKTLAERKKKRGLAPV